MLLQRVKYGHLLHVYSLVISLSFFVLIPEILFSRSLFWILIINKMISFIQGAEDWTYEINVIHNKNNKCMYSGFSQGGGRLFMSRATRTFVFLSLILQQKLDGTWNIQMSGYGRIQEKLSKKEVFEIYFICPLRIPMLWHVHDGLSNFILFPSFSYFFLHLPSPDIW